MNALRQIIVVFMAVPIFQVDTFVNVQSILYGILSGEFYPKSTGAIISCQTFTFGHVDLNCWSSAENFSLFCRASAGYRRVVAIP